jgi:hypothetical protein
MDSFDWKYGWFWYSRDRKWKIYGRWLPILGRSDGGTPSAYWRIIPRFRDIVRRVFGLR